MYCTVIKHDGHNTAHRVFYISRVFSNVRSVLSQCNTWLRLLHLLNKRFFYVLYSDKTCVFHQSERAQGPIYIIKDIMNFSVAVNLEGTCIDM